MNKCTHKVQVLPDMEMYGGDTTPWAVNIILPPNGASAFEDLSGFQCTLSLLQYRNAVAQTTCIPLASPALAKSVSISRAPGSDNVTALFEFEIADTINLSGKFIYQIAITNNDEMYLSQGFLLIKPNVNKE